MRVPQQRTALLGLEDADSTLSLKQIPCPSTAWPTCAAPSSCSALVQIPTMRSFARGRVVVAPIRHKYTFSTAGVAVSTLRIALESGATVLAPMLALPER